MTASDGTEATVAGLRSLAQSYDSNAIRCQAIGEYLSKQSGGMYWKSNAASSFQQNMEQYKKLLERLGQEFRDLAVQLKQRADLIEQSQSS